MQDGALGMARSEVRSEVSLRGGVVVVVVVVVTVMRRTAGRKGRREGII
jgi:hypothetical protein